MELRLGVCRTGTILDYRPVVFIEAKSDYVEIRSREGRRVVARVLKGPCVGVSREVAYLLYPYYGWDHMEIQEVFYVEEVSPPPATRVVMKVPFGIGEVVIKRQLVGFPIYEGALALEYLEHIEYGEVVHVEPQNFSILREDTAMRIVEIPVADDAVVFMAGRRV